MKVWSKGLFTYAEDDRVGVIKKLLRAVMTLKDIQASIIYLGPENVLFAICQDSVIYYLNWLHKDEAAFQTIPCWAHTAVSHLKHTI